MECFAGALDAVLCLGQGIAAGAVHRVAVPAGVIVDTVICLVVIALGGFIGLGEGAAAQVNLVVGAVREEHGADIAAGGQVAAPRSLNQIEVVRAAGDVAGAEDIAVIVEDEGTVHPAKRQLRAARRMLGCTQQLPYVRSRHPAHRF